MTAVSRQRQRRHLRYAFVLSALAVLAGYLGVLPIFRSHLKAYLGIGDARFGFLFSIGALPGLVSVLLGGQLVDRWGPRRVIRVGLLGIGSAMLIIALCGARFWAFAAAFGISGILSRQHLASVPA